VARIGDAGMKTAFTLSIGAVPKSLRTFKTRYSPLEQGHGRPRADSRWWEALSPPLTREVPPQAAEGLTQQQILQHIRFRWNNDGI